MDINLVAPINQLGYGVVGYNILKALGQAGHDVSYWPIGDARWESPAPFAQQAMERAKTFNASAPSIRIWHQNALDMFPGRGTSIGWPIFELDNFNEVELLHLRSVDKLFVCSQWAKDVLLAVDDTLDISVVPLGVDNQTFFVDHNAIKQRKYWTHDKTVFLNVGKWEVRKGHNELLEAFCKAFKPSDNVELWMLNENPFINFENENWKAKYMASPMGANIRIIPRINTSAELRQLYNTVDFGVFPSHAEGWNLEPLEMMACGKPSIVTNYSGHTEFCNVANSLLVEPNGMESAQDGRWFHGEGEWCTFDVDELVDTLRVAHDMKGDESYTKLANGALKTAEMFSWTNSVKKIEVALSSPVPA